MALECYRAASALGHAKAIYNVGVFYVHGLGGLQKDRRAAHECFRTAANLGLEDAKAALEMPRKTKQLEKRMSKNFIISNERHQLEVVL